MFGMVFRTEFHNGTVAGPLGKGLNTPISSITFLGVCRLPVLFWVLVVENWATLQAQHICPLEPAISGRANRS